MKWNENKTLWLTRTGTTLALYLLLQWLLSYTEAYLGPFLSGTVLCCILVSAALLGGLWCGAAVGILAPFCAYVFGLGPQVFGAVPAIALGNAVLAFLAVLVLGQQDMKLWKRLLGCVLTGAVSFLALYCGVIAVLIPAMGPFLPLSQEEILREIFSWPQLVTAVAGTLLSQLPVSLWRKHQKQ